VDRRALTEVINYETRRFECSCSPAGEGESFFIGDDIQVVILEAGSQVRDGINAPRHVEIFRTELIPTEEFEAVDDQSVR
jgi:carbon storage regulator CsrA